MSNWYIPPCDDYNDGFFHYNFSDDSTWPILHLESPLDYANRTSQKFESRIKPDEAFYFDLGTIEDCTRKEGSSKYEKRIKYRGNMIMYCTDAATSVRHAVEYVHWEKGGDAFPPTILQFGDLKYSHSHRFLDSPVLKKFRSATTTQNLQKVTDASECYAKPREFLQNAHGIRHMQPIVWKLATHRHYRLLPLVQKEDRPWEEKINMAVFRGQLTGGRFDGYDPNLPDETNCLNMRRCRLVYNNANSKLVNARLTSTRGKVPKELNGVTLFEGSVPIGELLRFKAIIMLEGNDVASGLKWALLSESVVMMTPPKHTSWAMEEFLEPWVHYIPLLDDLSDVEEKMMWIIEHDEEAHRISEQGALWMEDLCFHPDALEDDRWIQQEIIRRYEAQFRIFHSR